MIEIAYSSLEKEPCMQNEYLPDSVSAPAETLQETLDVLGEGCATFAQKMGMSREDAALLLSGDKEIDGEIAALLQHVTRVPALFWLRREAIYRDSLARRMRGEV